MLKVSVVDSIKLNTKYFGNKLPIDLDMPLNKNQPTNPFPFTQQDSSRHTH